MAPPPMASREAVREARLGDVWSNDLNDVFADVAPYYDRANNIAALGQFGNFLRRFMQLVELKPQQKVLDVCAGTNAIGIALLKREPTLDVHAIDRSAAMQTVGQQRAAALGFNIKSTIGDVHKLPFPRPSLRHRHAAVRLAPPARARGVQRDPARAETRRPFPPFGHAAPAQSDREEPLLHLLCAVASA
jgi:SAM-dependent methyltransferase